MIVRLAFLGGLLLALYAGWRWWTAQATSAQKAQALRWAAVGVIALALLLSLRGGGAMAIPLLLLLGPLLRRWLMNPAVPATAGATDRRSQVTTRFLQMSLDHDNGVMRGKVIAGRYQGQLLEDLGWSELTQLWRECQSDPQSAAVLEAYLDRTQADWRERLDQRRANAAAGLDIERQEAYEILGLQPGAGPDEIKAAHRRLLQRVHPDRGGSDYLAARVNKAKDLLLNN